MGDKNENTDKGLFSSLAGYAMGHHHGGYGAHPPQGYGYPPQGYPPSGYPPHGGYSPAGYPPPPGAYPPPAYPPHGGYPPASYPPAYYPGPSASHHGNTLN